MLLNKGLPRSLRQLYRRVEALEEGSTANLVTSAPIVSAGSNIDFPAGTPLETVLQAIADAADPQV